MQFSAVSANQDIDEKNKNHTFSTEKDLKLISWRIKYSLENWSR